MCTVGLRIVIQGYSYRYRYRVLMGQGRCRPPLTPSTLTFTGPKSRRELGPEVRLAHCQTYNIRSYVIRSYAWRR